MLVHAQRDLYRMVPAARPYIWLALLGSVVLALADGLVAIAIMPLVGQVVGGSPDGVSLHSWLGGIIEPERLQDPVIRLMASASVLVGGIILRHIVNGVVQTIAYAASLRVVMRLRDLVVQALLRTTFTYLDTVESGHIRQAVMTEMPQAGSYVRAAIGFVSNFLTAAVILCIMMYSDAVLVALTLAVTPLALAWKYFYSRFLYRKATQRTEVGISLAQTLNEAILGARQLKLTNREAEFTGQLWAQSRETERARNAQFLLVTWEPLLIQVTALAVIVSLIWFAPLLGISSFDRIVIFAFLLYRLMPSLLQMSTNFNSLLIAEPSVGHALKVYSGCRAAHEELRNRPDDVKLSSLEDIRFVDVDFAFGQRRRALRRVSFAARRGEMIAVAGKSGAGKSSLVHLLLGMYQPTAGSILLDGHDLRAVDLETLRRQIGIVTQDVHLFDTTIRDVIAAGRRDVPEEEIRQSARLADIEDFIESLPRRYDTRVGERGMRMSGGQRQRLLLAQVLARRPSVIVFDEATSALDLVTEQRVFETLQRLQPDHILIVITHRLSNLRNASRIYVLEDGAVAQCGTWEQLSAVEGAFQRLLQHSSELPIPAASS